MPKYRFYASVIVNITEDQLSILKGAYNDLRYAFFNCGYPDAGSFQHCLKYGYFELTGEEFKRLKVR